MPVSLTSNEPEIRARVFERLSRTLEQDQVRRGVFKDFPPLLKATFAALVRPETATSAFPNTPSVRTFRSSNLKKGDRHVHSKNGSRST